MKSPFEYSSPEAMTASDVIELFVPVFGEYHNIPNIGHTFINGPRGSGKSMIFRYMSPDCQLLLNKSSIENLEYFGIHIPIKEGQLDKTDLKLLKGNKGELLLNEHFMIVNFAIKIFEVLAKVDFKNSEKNLNSLRNFYNNEFKELLYTKEDLLDDKSENDIKACKEYFLKMKKACSKVNSLFSNEFIPKLYLSDSESIKYEGPIYSFHSFLLELLRSIKQLPFMPNGPIYLLIDDADNLSEVQTKILNTWVSSRTSKTLSFKISTQLRYKTYRTINGSRIDTPHDYAEINLSDIYTTSKGQYKDRVREAVERRLKKFGLKEVSADDFFPDDVDQEKNIEKLFAKYKEQYGYDYAYRYARPDFMKRLKGNLNTYSYAGFNSLVHISSGVMRHFIDFAHKMFTHQYSKYESEVLFIDPEIQNTEIKNYSIWYFQENFTKLLDDRENTDDELNEIIKLRNLLEALGQTFNLILFSDATERRVFSFALQDEPNDELRRVLKLGVETGYLHKSFIGNKMGTGKAQLFVLNRLLAPYFKLDPTSFAGYKFVTSQVLMEAIYKPTTVIGRIKTKGVDSVMGNPQQSLFKDEDYGYN